MLPLVREFVPQARLEESGGKGVLVAILDTWPYYDGDAAALPGGAAAAHVRIQNFVAANAATVDPDVGRLLTIPPQRIYSRIDPRAAHGVRCYYLNDNAVAEKPYDMASHGLFVTGIIQDMAPDAQISVYRVLDDNGVGDLAVIAKAMQDALAEARCNGKKLVLNMSLGVAPPIWLMEALLADDDCFFGKPSELRRAILRSAFKTVSRSLQESMDDWEALGLISQASRQFTGMLQIVDAVLSIKRSPDALLIAAAGNDSFGDSRRMGPRLPAALEGALAVSSHLPTARPWPLSRYSNDDDFFTDNDGVGAFGGDTVPDPVDDGSDSADPGRTAPLSVIAPYIREPLPEPPGQPAHNSRGLAYWSGTSFATPVAAGFAASMWSADLSQASGSVYRRVVFDGKGQDREALPFTQRFSP
ncbi:MAG TPA: S8/S53 family peptidase [Dehalococcoidia bacterium]|nr:S8/S53 family peptidase [Dehalococcoidia bacterium]